MSIHIIFNASKSQKVEVINTSAASNVGILTQLKIKKKDLKVNLFLESVFDGRQSSVFDDLCVVYREINDAKKVLFSGTPCNDPVPQGNGLLHLFFQEDLAAMPPCPSDDVDDVIDITGHIFESTIQQEQIFLPQCINVCLSAEWVQKNTGCTDIGQYIANNFPNGIISSLNNDFSVQQQSVRKTGYTVLSISFTPISPAQTGCLDIYKSSTPPFETDNGEECSIPYHWFSCNFKIDWNYEQKRVETLSFCLPFFGDSANSLGADLTVDNSNDQVADFSLKITDLEKLQGFDDQQSSFFDTELGKKVALQCIEHIKEKVISKKKGSISFEMDFETGCDLSIGQMVKISAKDLNIFGQISQVELIADGPYRSAKITVTNMPQWLEDWEKTRWNISEVVEGTPIAGRINHPFIHQDIVEAVTVENCADSLSSKILQRRFAAAEDVMDFVKENPTRITVLLRDLRTQKVLLHKMRATLYSPKERLLVMPRETPESEV
ncbi:MAG: hypothetical protein LBF84_03040 [Holosporales bacterium]|nr:hypothetical protein [Holosporales bacterium]